MLKKYKKHIIVGVVIIAAIAAYYFYKKKKVNGSKYGNSSTPAGIEDDPTGKLTGVKTETDKANVERAMSYLN
jgi:hypothetical protein